MAIPSWPSYANDTGAYNDGTILQKSFYDSIHDAIDTQIISAANPGVTAVYAIDSIKAAEGSKASLDARLDVLLEEDGTFKAPATVVTQAQLQATLGASNLIVNDVFLIWAAGDSAAPTGWIKGGTGTLARTGTGLSDTKRKIGDFALSITNAGNIHQDVVVAADMTRFDFLKNEKVSMGCWVNSSIASHSRLTVGDGVSSTSSDWHTGGSGWEFLTVTHTISAAATNVRVSLVVASNGAGYFSGATLIRSDQAPAFEILAPVVRGAAYFPVSGDWAAKASFATWDPYMPAIFQNVSLRAVTAPTGAAIICDAEVYDGSTWQSMFSTKPQIAISAFTGGAEPDGTYRYRCVAGRKNADSGTNSAFRVAIDQVGSAVAGAEGYIQLAGLQYKDPLLSLKAI